MVEGPDISEICSKQESDIDQADQESDEETDLAVDRASLSDEEKASIHESPSAELKTLPKELWYEYLDTDCKCPVIVNAKPNNLVT